MTAPAASGAPTVQRMLADAFRRFGDRPCLLWEGGSASYVQTARRVGRIAGWLDGRVRETRHVAIALPNGREYVESILACTLSGCTRVPLSPKEPVDVLAAKLGESASEVLVCTPEVAELLGEWIAASAVRALVVGSGPSPHDRYAAVVDGAAAPWRRVREDERYRLSFTGGTTGTPKAVVQTHRQERAMIRNLLMEVVRPAAGTVFVAATPLAHAAGAFVLPTVLWGGGLSWLERFDPARLVDASWLPGDLGAGSLESFVVPTVLGDVAGAAGPRHALRTLVYGGAPCPAPVLAAAVERLGPDVLNQVYGQAEAPVTICVASPADHAAGRVVDGWVGFPFRFVDVSVDGGDGGADDGTVEVGEIVVRGEHVMEGYWGRPEETAERLDVDGGLHTGDVGRLDDAGGLRIVGRAREMLISGGFNVYPDDVERRLRLHGVGDQAISVFGVPHERWGEAVVVAMVRNPGEGDDEQRDRVARVAEESLSYYERPKSVLLLDDLPVTSVGKVARQALAQEHVDLFAAGRPGAR
jgi:fatty-acyl-CoA synthase